MNLTYNNFSWLLMTNIPDKLGRYRKYFSSLKNNCDQSDKQDFLRKLRNSREYSKKEVTLSALAVLESMGYGLKSSISPAQKFACKYAQHKKI